MKKLILISFILFIAVVSIFIYSNSPRYTKVSLLSDRLTNTPTLVRELVDKDERIANNEYYLTDEQYESNGGFLIRSEYYCSYNISGKIPEISNLTDTHYYKGDVELISQEEFIHYISTNNAFCVHILPLNNSEKYGDIKKALSWGLEAEKMAIYKKKEIF